VTQPVTLHVEVTTQGRFNGGTRIRGLQMGEVIALPPPAFAVNATRTEGGKLWAIQTWRLTLYPLADKKYLVPALSLDVEIVDSEGTERRGVLKTKPQSFTTVLPPNIAGKTPWLAAEGVTLTSTLSGPTENLAQGAALIRTLKLEAQGVPGMMLPELPSLAIAGLAVYPDAPDVKTVSNRGSLKGARRQRTTYIVQKPGRYLLPEVRLNWWNIQKGQWELANAPAQIIQTKGVSSSAPLIQAKPSASRGQNFFMEWLWLIAGAGLLGGLTTSAFWLKHSSSTLTARWKLRRHVRKALAAGKTLRAIRLFYQWYDRYSVNRKTPSVRDGANNADFEALMERGFSDRVVKTGPLPAEVIFSTDDHHKKAENNQSNLFSIND
ncbi:MAG: BatD family protein, partial [Parvibaculaceae bacterium]|nr:BatD family protein [Parvibaculaceae bacterium]